MNNPNTSFFWDKKISEGYGKILSSPIYKDKIDTVAGFLKGLEGKLLDIGVGYGVLEGAIIKKSPKLELFGIDISKKAINQVKALADGQFITATATNLPFKVSFFDYVAILDVLEHFWIKDIKKILKETYRVLKGRGMLIVSVPLNESARDKFANKHLTSFTELSISRLLKINGFAIEKSKLLFAFRNAYFFKSLLARHLGLRKPNLIIILCHKK